MFKIISKVKRNLKSFATYTVELFFCGVVQGILEQVIISEIEESLERTCKIKKGMYLEYNISSLEMNLARLHAESLRRKRMNLELIKLKKDFKDIFDEQRNKN